LAPCTALLGCTDHDSQFSQQGSAVAISVDPRGLPRMVQARDLAPAPAATATDSARIHVERLAGMWGVAPGTLPDLRALGEVPAPGGKIARIAQEIDGLPVWGREMRVLVRPDGALATASGTLVGTLTPRAPARFVKDEPAAVATAVKRAYGSPAGVMVEETMAKRVWYPSGNQLVAAWVVDAYTSRGNSTHGDAHRTILTADTGRVLEHYSLVSDATFDYRVFAETTGKFQPLDGPTEDVSPHPTGTPNGFYPPYLSGPALVSVGSLNKHGDPWLPDDATETNGNNVDAYVDINAPSGLTEGDFRASITGANAFDHAYDVHAEPMSTQTQQMAAVTSLFYNINWLHDFWYDAGFTEAAGNGQKLNYGRGGIEGDAMRAEAQDNANGGSRNNANMSTPGDGMSPRMQVFLWTGKEERTLTLPNRSPSMGTASFGPKNFDITATLLIGTDSTEPNVTDGCEPIQNTVTGAIVLVDRGNCSFKTKALNIQNAGGIGMILANNAMATSPPGLGDDAMITTAITIPSVSVTLAEGDALKAEIAQNHFPVTLYRQVGQELDGSLDATLIAHEFGHYLHHRLSLCGGKMCGAMSEGWGDFLALMMLVREGDNLDGAYPFSVYTTQSFSSDAAYFGIRRAPYSVNKDINALMYRHWADGEPLNFSHPFNGRNDNSQVHNAGEVWASALWEGYVALQKAGSSFAEVHQRMAEYIVAGLLLTPPEATPMEVRDSILAATLAANRQADHDILIAAFARRGFGSCAEPPADPATFKGLVESIEVAGKPALDAYSLTDDCDKDGVLDAGETATMKVKLVNKGHAALSNVKLDVTTAVPGVTVTSPATTVATLPQFGTTELEVEVKLADARTPIAGDLSLTITAEGGCQESISVPVAFRLNVDDVPERSAIETFDTELTVWQAEGEAWSHIRVTALNGAWHGVDASKISDSMLTSPLLQAAADQPLMVTFQHKFSFEASGGKLWDGGVIEYSIDDGATWEDVSALTSPGYTGTLTDEAGNPLGGRPGFGGNNLAWPSYDTVRLDFGTQLAGKQFRLRFRVGTDENTGAPGWTIDEIAFAGIVGTPFPLQLPDAGSCLTGDPDPDGPGDDGDGGCCDAGPLRGSSALLALGVLGLVLRRRRRR
jgi:large repetitive protein